MSHTEMMSDDEDEGFVPHPSTVVVAPELPWSQKYPAPSMLWALLNYRDYVERCNVRTSAEAVHNLKPHVARLERDVSDADAAISRLGSELRLRTRAFVESYITPLRGARPKTKEEAVVMLSTGLPASAIAARERIEGMIKRRGELERKRVEASNALFMARTATRHHEDIINHATVVNPFEVVMLNASRSLVKQTSDVRRVERTAETHANLEMYGESAARNADINTYYVNGDHTDAFKSASAEFNAMLIEALFDDAPRTTVVLPRTAAVHRPAPTPLAFLPESA